MMFWIVCWVLALLIFLLVPVICNPEQRRIVVARLRTCRWRVSDEETNGRDANGRNAQDGSESEYHYVLSRAQEDEIRESFLVEKLRMFTKNISASDIAAPSTPRKMTSESGGTVPENASDDSLASSTDEGNDDNNNSASDEEEANDSCNVMEEIMNEAHGHVTLPTAGECRPDILPDGVQCTERTVPNGCAICLGVFEESDAVTWASNENCNHVFHQDCILDWLKASGRKVLRRRRRQEEESGMVNYANNPVLKITKFPMLCPCCRQDFVIHNEEEEDLPMKEVDLEVESGAVSDEESQAAGSASDEDVVGPSTSAVVSVAVNV